MCSQVGGRARRGLSWTDELLASIARACEQGRCACSRAGLWAVGMANCPGRMPLDTWSREHELVPAAAARHFVGVLEGRVTLVKLDRT
jgi:hypothetical protein